MRRLAPDALELTIHEGRKRQVRRMCAAVGHPVRRSSACGSARSSSATWRPERHRRLAAAEVERLRRAAGSAR